jgi:hypothetical protein
MDDADAVVAKDDCLLGGKSCGDLKIGRWGLEELSHGLGAMAECVQTLPRRYSDVVQNSWWAFSFWSRHVNPKT